MLYSLLFAYYLQIGQTVNFLKSKIANVNFLSFNLF